MIEPGTKVRVANTTTRLDGETGEVCAPFDSEGINNAAPGSKWTVLVNLGEGELYWFDEKELVIL